MASPPRKHSDEKDEASPWKISPVNFLLFASVPFVFGSYIGYKRSFSSGNTELVARRILAARRGGTRAASSTTPPASVAARSATEAVVGSSLNPDGPLMAARALGIGTMLSIGGVSLLSAAVFYFSGYDSISAMIEGCRAWAPAKRRQLEVIVGLPRSPSLDHPDFEATRGMSEDDELDYVKKKYLSGLYENKDEDTTRPESHEP